MKYYLYISDTKVDMLYNQMPHAMRERVAAELKIDLKIFSTTISGQTSEKNRYSKLELISKYLKEHESIGSIDEPNTYFAGTIRMSGISIGDYESRYFKYMRDIDRTNKDAIHEMMEKLGTLDRTPQMIYYGGITETTILGLAGSFKHLIGQSEAPHERSFSDPISILDAINKFVLADGKGIRNKTIAKNDMTHLNGMILYSEDSAKGDIIDLVGGYLQQELAGYKTQRVEFLAKRLAQGYIRKLSYKLESQGARGGRQVVLGTPIYVSLAE